MQAPTQGPGGDPGEVTPIPGTAKEARALTGSPLGPFSPGAPLRPASPCGRLGDRLLRPRRLNAAAPLPPPPSRLLAQHQPSHHRVPEHHPGRPCPAYPGDGNGVRPGVPLVTPSSPVPAPCPSTPGCPGYLWSHGSAAAG